MRWHGILLAAWLALGGQAQASCEADRASDEVMRAVALVSGERVRAGLGPVRLSDALGRAAARHACDMATTGVRSHVGSDGSRFAERIHAAGYRACLRAENIAWGARRPDVVVRLWMASHGHRANILEPRVDEVGVAVVRSGREPIWVMVFAQPC